jgi:hypothetical protein
MAPITTNDLDAILDIARFMTKMELDEMKPSCPPHVVSLAKHIPYECDAQKPGAWDGFYEELCIIEKQARLTGTTTWSWERPLPEVTSATTKMFLASFTLPTVAIQDQQNGFSYYIYTKEEIVEQKDLMQVFHLPPFLKPGCRAENDEFRRMLAYLCPPKGVPSCYFEGLETEVENQVQDCLVFWVFERYPRTIDQGVVFKSIQPDVCLNCGCDMHCKACTHCMICHGANGPPNCYECLLCGWCQIQKHPCEHTAENCVPLR